MMDSVNFTAFDLETAESNKHICQIGIVVVRNGVIVEEKSILIQPPGNKISKYTMNIHGINPTMTKDAPLLCDIWNELKPYFEKQVIIHHSDGFDPRVMSYDLALYAIEYPRVLSEVSTMSLFPAQYSRSLKNLCLAYDIEMAQHHDAVSDARCCAQLMLKHLSSEDPNYDILPQKKTSENQNISFKEKFDKDYLLEKETFVQDLSIVENVSTIFYDKKVVISGTFERFPVRNDLGLLLKKYGADVNSSLSGKTNLFVIGKDAGPSKIKKFLKLRDNDVDILLIEENELNKILDNIK